MALVLVALGAVNRYRSIPRMDDRPGLLTRVMTVEIVGAVGVFALTGVLTGLSPQPASEPPAPRPRDRGQRERLRNHDERHAHRHPGHRRSQRFRGPGHGLRLGHPVDATGVSLRFEPVGQAGVGPSTLDLTRTGTRWRNAGTQLSLDGVWNVTVVVQTATNGTEVPLVLATRLVRIHPSRCPPQKGSLISTRSRSTLGSRSRPTRPGTPGPDELHMTAFGADGNELPLAGATMTAISPDGTAVPLDARRFSPGHFVSDITLTTGDWTFFISATTRQGENLVASFDQTI